jgi:lysozyme
MNRAALIAMLARHEGIRLFPYLDTVGKTTIGCGRNLTDRGISREESDLLCCNDIDAVLADLATFAWWTGLDDARQQALADLRFNLGADGFREFRQMIHALAVKDYIGAAREMRASRWAQQVGMRAGELALMMEQG